MEDGRVVPDQAARAVTVMGIRVEYGESIDSMNHSKHMDGDHDVIETAVSAEHVSA